jgi:hypothetical protein
MLADKSEHGLFDMWTKRLDRIEGQRKAIPFVGVEIADRLMRAARRKRYRDPRGRDTEAGIQEDV